MNSRSEKESEKVFHRLLLANLSEIKRSLRKFFSDYSLAVLYYIMRLVRVQKLKSKKVDITDAR